MQIDYSQLPEHMQEGARLYVEHGIEPGSFMHAALSNNLIGAFNTADHINLTRMEDWALWLYSECPFAARGSREKVEAWIKAGGLSGIQREAREGNRE